MREKLMRDKPMPEKPMRDGPPPHQGSRSRARRDRGVALVEFAIVVPLLLLLLFGIIEFGWAFFQKLDVRSGARETSRLAAVNFGPGSGDSQRDALVTEACTRLDPGGLTDVDIAITKSGSAVGDEIIVTVKANLTTLTGALDPFLRNLVLTSSVKTRAEQPITWSDEPAEPLPGVDCP